MPKAINKVVYGGNTILDLTDLTVDQDKLLRGYTARRADGNKVTGTVDQTVEYLQVGGTVTLDENDYLEFDDSGGITPTGTIAINQNGVVDVTNYASANVNVPSPVKTATGTFTGNGTRQVTIPCDFEPDLIYWTSNPGTTASSGTVAGIIARGMMAANRYRNNSTSNSHYAVIDITDMNTGGSSYSHRATYADSTVTLYCFSNNARSLFTNGRSYTYRFLKWTT